MIQKMKEAKFEMIKITFTFFAGKKAEKMKHTNVLASMKSTDCKAYKWNAINKQRGRYEEREGECKK